MIHSVIRGSAAGGSARAKAVSVAVPPASGLLTTVSSFGLLAPVAFAKTGGSANLTIAVSTGAVSAASALAAGVSQSLIGTASGADGCVLPFTVTLTGATATPAPTPAITPPVQDWRAVTTEVTDLAGAADAAMQAQQASKATKTRGASFTTGASASNGRVFKLAAHTQPVELYWWGLGQNGSSTVDVSTDNGVTWVGTGFTNQMIPGGSIADRMQCCRIPAGASKWIRLTCSSSSSYTVWPQLHEKPASGLSPVVIVWGNSIPHYHLAGDTSGSPATSPAAFMNAMIAAAGGDPIVILASEPSAQISGLQGHLTAVLNTWGSFASTGYLCGLVGGDATALHPYQSGQKAALDTAFDTFVGQVKAAGLQVMIDELSFMFGASDETPLSTLVDQTPGRGLYNVNVVWPKIQQHAPASFNADLGVAQNGMYFWSVRRSADLTDGKHPAKNSFVDWQAFHANGWYKFWQTGAWGTHQVYQRINTAEATLLRPDYDWITPTLQLLPATAAKTAIVNRQTALLPYVLLKSANLAVAIYEASKTPTDKTAAQDAVAAATGGGASAGDVGAVYGQTVNLSGTTNLTARINAVSSVTITKRVKIGFGKASYSGLPTFNAVSTASTLPQALFLDDGTTVSGFSLASTNAANQSAANGSNVALGVAPILFPAAIMQAYMNRTSTGANFVFTGLDNAKLYRFYLAASLSAGTDRTETVTATGANGATTAAKNPASSGQALFGPTDGLTAIQPTGGQITITLTAAGGNTGATYANGLIIEEYTV